MLNEYLIKDLVSEVIDNRGKSPEYHQEITEYPIIEVNSISGDRAFPVEDKFKKYVSKEVYENWFRNGHPQKNDLLIATVGSIGEVALFNGRGCIAQNLIALRFNKKLCNQEFIYYLFSSKRYKSLLVNLDIGSVQPSIKVPHILNSTIHIPDLRYQQFAANLLSRFDKKIELNQKMNETLEEITKTLFKSWFIDFDPVRAKSEGRPTGLSKEISDLFPDSFEDSELGEIPKGWKVRPLGDFYTVNKGLSYKGKFLTEHGMPMINLGCFGGNGIFLKEKIKPYSGEFKKRHVISKGDIAIANTDITQNRITLGSPIMVGEIDGNSDFLFTHHVFCLKNISDREDLKYFTYHTLLNPKFRGIAGNYATGTTVLALPKDVIENFQVALSSKQILNAFNEIADQNFKKSKIDYEESIILGNLRDKLLPKLISGELKIPDVENLIEEAGI